MKSLHKNSKSKDVIEINEHFIEIGFLNSPFYPLVTEVIYFDRNAYYLFGKFKIWQNIHK